MRRVVALSMLALAACGDEAVPAPTPPAVTSYQGTLSLEVRGTADVTLLHTGPDTIDVSLALRDVNTRGIFDSATVLSGPGRREPFPETQSELFTSTFALAPSTAADPPCGAAPVTLALALHRRAPNLRVGGSLSAYCGDQARGVPAWIFRLSGTLSAR
jgi:hypothetical protein